jgi:hypothetical protein
MLGQGLSVSEEGFWQAQTKRNRPTFRHENISTCVRIMWDTTAAMLSGRRNAGHFHKSMMSLTLDIVAKSLLGSDVSKEVLVVGRAATAITEEHFGRPVMAFILTDKITIPTSARLKRSSEQLDATAYESKYILAACSCDTKVSHFSWTQTSDRPRA